MSQYRASFTIVIPALLCSLVWQPAWAESGNSRSVCTHQESELPRIVEVVYDNNESPLPCKVLYEKNGTIDEVAAAQNSRGHCEKTERKIVLNLVAGGYECKHDFEGLGDDIDGSVKLDLFGTSAGETDGLVASPERENARPDISGSERQSPRNDATEEHVHEFVHIHPLTIGGLPQEHTHLATMSSVGSGLASNIQDLSSSTSVDIADAVPEILSSGYQTTTENTPISQSALEVVDEETGPVIFNAQSGRDSITATWGILTRALPDEVYAHRLAGELRRRMPFVENRVVKRGSDSPEWHVALGFGDDENALRTSMANLDEQVQSIYSIVPMVAHGEQNQPPVLVRPDDWARYALASCWASGYRTSDVLSSCSSVAVDEETFINCFGGGICTPSRYDSEKVMSIIDFLDVIDADDPIAVARDRITQRLQGCQQLGDASDSEFSHCAVLSVLDDSQREMYDCYQRAETHLAMVECVGNEEIADYTRLWEQCSDTGYAATACLMKESSNDYLQNAAYCMNYEDAGDITNCAINANLSADESLLLSCLSDYSDKTEKATCLAREKLGDNEYAAISCASLADSARDYGFCVAERSGSVSNEALYTARCLESSGDLSPGALLKCGGSQYIDSDIVNCLNNGLEDPGCFDVETVIADLASNNLRLQDEMQFLDNEITRFRQEMFAQQGGDLGMLLAGGASASVLAIRQAAQSVTQAVGKAGNKSRNKFRSLFKFGK